jgi:capsular polysaccharide biosynthesis protein
MDGELVLRPLLDLRALARSVWRRKFLVAPAVVAGMLFGLLVASTALQATYATTASILLQPYGDEAIQPGSAMETQVQLAKSSRIVGTVRQRMADELGVVREEREVIRSFSAAAASDTVMELTVSSPERDQVVPLAEIVVEEVIAQRLDLVSAQLSAKVDELQRRLDDLEADSAVLDTEIDAILSDPTAQTPGSAAARRLAQVLEQRDRSTNAALDLRQRIQLDLVEEQTVRAGTQVVVTPGQLSGSKLMWTALVMIAFGILAAIAVCGLVVVREVLSTRLRVRADLAEATGRPWWARSCRPVPPPRVVPAADPSGGRCGPLSPGTSSQPNGCSA